ncbi:hypothetical protein CBM2599_A180044 [Cupriavidus taiwanensis]|nr:hypothetical protein CBM2599_A180044 [Cupriavidus taiwanensis]SOY86745.1 hypothetical protein CBM2600_A160044 [Cupriavidus taiwanensis]
MPPRTGYRRASSPNRCARPSASCRRRAAIAASPTSISAPAARKSAAPSAAKRRPAAAANQARMRGRAICAALPTPSTTAIRCRWHRASASKSDGIPGAAAWRVGNGNKRYTALTPYYAFRPYNVSKAGTCPLRPQG